MIVAPRGLLKLKQRTDNTSVIPKLKDTVQLILLIITYDILVLKIKKLSTSLLFCYVHSMLSNVIFFM